MGRAVGAAVASASRGRRGALAGADPAKRERIMAQSLMDQIRPGEARDASREEPSGWRDYRILYDFDGVAVTCGFGQARSGKPSANVLLAFEDPDHEWVRFSPMQIENVRDAFFGGEAQNMPVPTNAWIALYTAVEGLKVRKREHALPTDAQALHRWVDSFKNSLPSDV